MKALSLLTAALFLLSGGAFAQELAVTGAHSAQGALPVGEESWATGYTGPMKEPQIENTLGLEVSQGPVKLLSRWTATTTASATTVRNEEASIAWNPDRFKLSLGNQIFAWGTADGRNPTDNLNPRDYTSLSGQKVRKLPVWSASAVWYPTEEVSVETVFLPAPGVSLFPTDWVGALAANGLTATVEPAHSPSSAVAGGRVNYRSTAFDASASYLYDTDPLFTPVVNGAAVTLERRRVQRFGADLKTTVDRFGIWAEAAYSLTGNRDPSSASERLSRWDAVVGMDFSYGPGDSSYLNFQYAGTWVPGYGIGGATDPRTLLYSLGGIQEELLHSLILSSHWNLAEDTIVPALSATYSLPGGSTNAPTRHGSLLLKPEVDFMPVDSFHITVAAVLAWGDALAVYTPQNNLSITASYQWNDAVQK